MIETNEPIWVEINLDNLANNFNEVKSAVKDSTKIMAVIKANAYGHGALEVGAELINNGADKLAVARLNEALELRKEIKNTDILILGYTPDEFAAKLINNNITQTVYTLNQAKHFNKVAKKLNKKMKIHIKIDTGMRRLGFKSEDDKVIETIEEIVNMNGLDVEGIYTHFATADEEDKDFTKKQHRRFIKLIKKLENKNINIPIKHISNSAAIIDLPNYNYDMVRAGIMLYGMYPSNEVNKENVNLKPVMSFKTKIAYLKDVDKGEGISYGLVYKTKEKTRVGTLPVGYADGYTRLLSHDVKVIIDDTKVPVIGKICMDQMMVNVSDVKCSIGDEVILFGESENESIYVEELAKKLNTINYELVCMISRRVPRVYIKSNDIISIKDYLLTD